MFRSATLRLTLWYLTIVMIISLLFSVVLYQLATRELSNGLRHQSARLMVNYGSERPLFVGIGSPNDLEAELQAGSWDIFISLTIFNGLVLLCAGGLSYWLAQRTLRPIEVAHLAQKRFTADASHELRTPLTAMRTELEVALRNQQLSANEQHALLQSNLEEVIKLEQLSTALLELARNGETTTPQTATADLQKIIADALQRVDKLAQQRGITIQAELESLPVKGDRVALTELVVILLDNAIKYSPANSAVEVQAQSHTHEAILTVRDHGIGIQPADLPHVFDRFYRADQSRAKTIGGFGLGLSLAKLIIERHEGTITIDSTPNKGTGVTVKLPGGR